jgi:glutathione S-transferase
MTHSAPLAAPKLLRSAPASPFGRKVKIAAAVLGLDHAFEIVTANTLDDQDPVRRDNPLGKIPTLVLADGGVIYDSRVIVEYLDLFAGGGVIPANLATRMDALRQQALGDGLAEAALLLVYEGRFRPAERQEAAWITHQQGKVDRALAHLEATPPAAPSDKPHIGLIAIACALGYLDLRFEGRWRATHPRLVAWLDQFEAKVPMFTTTRAS